MSRRGIQSQLDRGVLSANTAGELIGHCGNSIRRWVKSKQLIRIPVPFSREIQISAFQLLAEAIFWQIKFKPELIAAAKNYVRHYDSSLLSRLEELETAYDKDDDGTFTDFLATYRKQNTELPQLRDEGRRVTPHDLFTTLPEPRIKTY